MSAEAYGKFQALQTQLEADVEYQELERRRREAEPGFSAALDALDRERRQDVLEYLGILQEQGLREIELACFISGK